MGSAQVHHTTNSAQLRSVQEGKRQSNRFRRVVGVNPVSCPLDRAEHVSREEASDFFQVLGPDVPRVCPGNEQSLPTGTPGRTHPSVCVLFFEEVKHNCEMLRLASMIGFTIRGNLTNLKNLIKIECPSKGCSRIGWVYPQFDRTQCHLRVSC